MSACAGDVAPRRADRQAIRDPIALCVVARRHQRLRIDVDGDADAAPSFSAAMASTPEPQP